MAEYYLDPTLSTGDNDGTTKPNAWRTLQRAVDGTDGTKPVGGDTVLCKAASGAQETLTTAVDISALFGTSADLVKFIAVNSSWVNDWIDRYTLDGNDASLNCLYGYINTDYTSWESFQFTQATGDGVAFSATSGAYNNHFINCEFDNCGDSGINGYRNIFGYYQHCIAHHNVNDGFDTITGHMLFCVSYLNGQYGFHAPYAVDSIAYGCISYLNTYSGFGSIDASLPLIHCISHNNGRDGLAIYNDGLLVLGSRFTLNDEATYGGIDCSAERAYLFGNYFQGNTSSNNIYNILNNDLKCKIIGVDTNKYDQGDTDYGYNDSASADFNLIAAATLRDFEITLPG